MILVPRTDSNFVGLLLAAWHVAPGMKQVRVA